MVKDVKKRHQIKCKKKKTFYNWRYYSAFQFVQQSSTAHFKMSFMFLCSFWISPWYIRCATLIKWKNHSSLAWFLLFLCHLHSRMVFQCQDCVGRWLYKLKFPWVILSGEMVWFSCSNLGMGTQLFNSFAFP